MCHQLYWITSCFLILGLSITTSPIFAGGCVSSSTTLCLNGDRYQVNVDWQSSTDSGQGQVFPVSTGTTGFFTLDDDDQVETMIRVVDGCLVNDHHWVFLTDLSELDLDISITDTSTGNFQQYFLPLGTSHNPLADLEALPCTAESSEKILPQRGAGSGVVALVGGRFLVSVEWESSDGSSSGSAGPISLTDSSGAFWYFNPGSPDQLVTIEPHASNGFYRFVGGSPTVARHTVTVFDRCHNSSRVYDLLPGGPLFTIVDEQMHPVDCTDFLFANDFESGNFSFWSSFF